MREQIDKQRNDDGKSSAQCKSIFRAAPDPLVISGPVILCGESGVGISEILHRQIGKGINFHSGRKCRHDRRTEAVDEPLYHQNAEIHDRLLNAGHRRKIQNLF